MTPTAAMGRLDLNAVAGVKLKITDEGMGFPGSVGPRDGKAVGATRRATVETPDRDTAAAVAGSENGRVAHQVGDRQSPTALAETRSFC